MMKNTMLDSAEIRYKIIQEMWRKEVFDYVCRRCGKITLGVRKIWLDLSCVCGREDLDFYILPWKRKMWMDRINKEMGLKHAH